MTAIALNNIALPSVGVPRVALPFNEARRGGGGSVSFVDIQDPEVLRVLIAHGMSSSPLGLTTDDTGAITSFRDWFVGNTEVRYFNLAQFPNLVDADLSGTTANVEFVSLNEEHGISSLMLDDYDNEIVPKEEIDEYLKNLR